MADEGGGHGYKIRASRVIKVHKDGNTMCFLKSAEINSATDAGNAMRAQNTLPRDGQSREVAG